jgi:hypothetical protein
LVIRKVKIKITKGQTETESFKYLVWVYNTKEYRKTKLSDISLNLSSNRVRGIYDMNGSDLKKIYDMLAQDKSMYNKPKTTDGLPSQYFPHFNNMVVNKIFGGITEVFHIHILPRNELYISNQYNGNYTPITENREMYLLSAVLKCLAYPDYYLKMKESQMRVFGTLIPASL